MTRPDYELADSLRVDSQDQHRALGNLTRYRILGLLLDRAMTASQLAESLGVLKGSVSFHVRTLERAGLIREVRNRRVRGVTERYFGRTARTYDMDGPEAPDADAGALILRTVAAERQRIRRPAASTDTVSTARARLDPDRAAEFRTRLEELMAAFRTASADGPAYLLTVAYFATDQPGQPTPGQPAAGDPAAGGSA